ncbi:hypothetical protein AMECASPLE_035347 [Ameca splendens]|uniref:Uncharacterized protein n=1 Tax=Ameca splendens TaxID=208324 RepID=A0ABV0ZT81_9TELE
MVPLNETQNMLNNYLQTKESFSFPGLDLGTSSTSKHPCCHSPDLKDKITSAALTFSPFIPPSVIIHVARLVQVLRFICRGWVKMNFIEFKKKKSKYYFDVFTPRFMSLQPDYDQML